MLRHRELTIDAGPHGLRADLVESEATRPALIGEAIDHERVEGVVSRVGCLAARSSAARSGEAEARISAVRLASDRTLTPHAVGGSWCRAGGLPKTRRKSIRSGRS